MFSFECIIAKVKIAFVCPVNVAINLNVIKFHTFIVLSDEPDTIFSFEGITAKANTARVCPVNIAINTES